MNIKSKWSADGSSSLNNIQYGLKYFSVVNLALASILDWATALKNSPVYTKAEELSSTQLTMVMLWPQSILADFMTASHVIAFVGRRYNSVVSQTHEMYSTCKTFHERTILVLHDPSFLEE